MEFSITITLMRDDETKEETLATLTFSPQPDKSSSLVIQQDLPVPRSTPVTIGSALMSNGNLSFAVFHGGIQYMLACARWDSLAPFFGVRLPGLGFMQAYFKKTER